MEVENKSVRTVLITGGTGFIGSYLAMAMLEQFDDIEIVLADSNPDRRRVVGFRDKYEMFKNRITFVQCDLGKFEHVLALFDNHNPQSVFHLGALLSAGADANPTQGFEVDLLGTRHVFEAARFYCQQKNQPPIKVLFPSTIASFGLFLPANPVTNESVQMPTTMYGLSKVACERLGEWYQSRKPDPWIDFRAVRFPSVIGAARGPGGTTVYSTLMIQQPLLDKQYEVFVQEETHLDILYVKDAVRALIGLHDADGGRLKRRVYNIAGLRINNKPPRAQEIKDAVVRQKPAAQAGITFKVNQPLQDIINSFGILDDSTAQADWDWKPQWTAFDPIVADFATDLHNYPQRLKSLELF